MIFTAMIRPIIMGAIAVDDPRTDGYWLGAYDGDTFHYQTTYIKMYIGEGVITGDNDTHVSDPWTPSFDIGGGNLIITSGRGNYAGLGDSGGLILSGNSLPFSILTTDGTTPALDANFNYQYWEIAEGSWYKEYSHFRSVIEEKKYTLGTGTPGLDSYSPGTLLSTSYFIHLAVPLIQTPGEGSRFIIISQREVTSSGTSDEAIDLRPYISNMTWTTSIEKGFDTATIEFNESASNLGKYYSYFLGQNVEIIDIYGNICWNGICTSIYVDGGGGRMDCVGYKQTMEWFRFDKAYLQPEAGWSDAEGLRGPTSSQVLHDTMLMNPYTKKIYGNNNPGTSKNWFLKGYVYDDDGNPTSPDTSWPAQQWVETNNIGLDELDFSDGSLKCIDAIQTIESFGYAYSNESNNQNSQDTMYMQFWANGWAKIIRVRKDPSTLRADYVITKKNIKTNNRGVEIAGDINDIITETYVIYNDSDGQRNVSGSTYDHILAARFGLRLRIESSDYGPALATLLTQVARADRSVLTGIGSVSISGNVKGGQGGMNNLPCYMMRAGRIVEFEDNIGHGSLYKNLSGSPGIFYIGSTSFSTDSGELILTPALTLSAVDLFIQRQSNLLN